jgi:D-cysteine desulfhydrase/L-cysteate sulfo-lyase
MTADDLRELLAGFPRAELARLPTSLEPLARLGLELGGPALYAKRDDAIGLAFGGNKIRQLEFYLGHAVSTGADTVLITGAVQSNFVRATAGAAAKLGLRCHVQLEERVAGVDAVYRSNGNALLDRLLGAALHGYPEGEDEEGADAALERLAEGLAAEGRSPYVIHLGPGHPPLGALGYVDAAAELLDQASAAGIAVTDVALGSGSGLTHAGLLVGLRLLGSEIRVHGMCVRRDAGAQAARVRGHVEALCRLLALDNPVDESDVLTDDRAFRPSYGVLNELAIEAIALAARQEGLLLDPVYTAKVVAGLAGQIRDGLFERDAEVVFLHTGGTPALFGYEPELTASLGELTDD